nr:TasA family protein [Sporosalibacterium faouarense]
MGVILVVILICSMAGAGTMAWFTSQATSDNNVFAAGTLILGSEGANNDDIYNTFEKVEFPDMEPGQPFVQVQETILKNVGSLPFYLYRMTASQLEDNNLNNEIDDTKLNDVLTLKITLKDMEEDADEEQVYYGKLSQLKLDNGGFFDPIYDVRPGEKKVMKIYAELPPEVTNEYQGLSMICDLTLYAKQNNVPIQGDPQNQWHDLQQGSVTNFSVKGINHRPLLRNLVTFDWDWNPDDSDYEFYEIMIKHETGDPNAQITEERWETEEPFLWWTIKTQHLSEDIEVYDMLTGEEVDLDKWDVIWDPSEDNISIAMSAFPSDWDGMEIKLSGTQYEDLNSPGNPEIDTIQSLPIQYWSFDR